MRILFRADASRLIGSGHLVRCRTLATALSRRGAETEFFCRRHGDNGTAILGTDSFRVRYLESTAAGPRDDGPYSHWLGTSEAEDAREFLAALQPERPDWIVVDHYALSAAWERSVRPHVDRILAIDDLGRTHAADALLDQNYALEPLLRYQGRVPPDSRLMLGPHYALLHEKYFDRRADRDRTQPVRRILIFFGGADVGNLTGLTMAALDQPALAGITADVVIGASNAHAEKIMGIRPANISVCFHRGLPDLADLLSNCDLAIGAGGGNTWERCCLGVPSIVIALADNQIPASEELGRMGIVEYLGRAADNGLAEIRNAVHRLIEDPQRRQSMAEQSSFLVDGCGALRVAEVLIPTLPSALTLRPALKMDRAYLFHLANDPVVRAQSFSTEKISWDAHKAWYCAKLSEPGVRLFVLEAQRLPVGMIRFEIADTRATLNYALDDLGRGKKWGVVLVELGLRALAAGWSGDVHALVKTHNRPSCAVFERLRFRTADRSEDQILYVLDAADLTRRFAS